MTTAAVALLTDGESALLAAGVAVGTVVVSAAASFWNGVANGLPEAE